MSALSPTIAHRQARNEASIELADTGAGTASIRLYTASGGTLLATRHLKKPCGSINAAGRIELAQAATTDLVLLDDGVIEGPAPALTLVTIDV